MSPEYIEKMCVQTALPQEAILIIVSLAKKLLGDRELLQRTQKIEGLFFDGEETRDIISVFAAEIGTSERALLLLFCYIYTEKMHTIYINGGLSEKIYNDSLLDLPIWAKVCRRDWGEWGMQEYEWVSRALRGKLYRLGRMQFERVEFEYERYEKNGIVIKKGDIVLNSHIPEGDSMTREKRCDSYRQATEIFGTNIFVMESYLLYPAQRQFLSPKSNIIDLMDDFDIIDTYENDKMEDMWRIYGKRDKYDPATLPRDTSLQRGYAEHIAATGLTGGGYGVMIFDEKAFMSR